jgi:DNA polymerase I
MEQYQGRSDWCAIDADFGVYDGHSFREERWGRWLAAHNIPWPRLDSGRLDLSDDTFRQMARAYAVISPIRELRASLSELRLEDLAVGSDGFNRTILSAFRARTGRNQPSNTRYIFGPSVWTRSLIKPPPGHGVAYIDWSQQEIGIAAALSGDVALQNAYESGDPYLQFAKQAGAVLADATKESHTNQRELFKQCALAVNYGMTARGLGNRIQCTPIVARDLIRAHQETYRTFWKWSDAAVDHGVLTGKLVAVFGWPIHVGADFNPRSLRNFPMQANGAEMLRLTTCYAIGAGLAVAALVHDAILIIAPAEQLEADVALARACMARASRDVLAGFELRTHAELTFHPDRYHDSRGTQMWRRVLELAAACEATHRGVA